MSRLISWWKVSVIPPVKKAVATFIFSASGILIGNQIRAFSDPVWEIAFWVGVGSLLNLIYRWSEAYLKSDA